MTADKKITHQAMWIEKITTKNMNLTNHKPLSAGTTAAFFFAGYAVLFMLFTKYTLLSLKNNSALPLIPSIIIALIVGALTGRLFGNSLVKIRLWFYPFLIGVLLACLSLILSGIGVLIYYYYNHVPFFNSPHHWQDYFILYGIVLLSLTLTIGLWLIPLTAVVAVYFNKRFWPGLLALDQKNL